MKSKKGRVLTEAETLEHLDSSVEYKRKSSSTNSQLPHRLVLRLAGIESFSNAKKSDVSPVF